MGLSTPKNQKELQEDRKKKNPVDFLEAEEPQWNLADIILNAETRKGIDEILLLILSNNKVFEEWGLNEIMPSKSKFNTLNFYGKPGTGKSITAEAIAYRLGKKIIKVNYADIESKYVGETPKNIVKIFEKASQSNAILFFDEADSILGKRLTNITNSTDTSVNLTRSVMLLQLDKFNGTVIFATNLYKNYDKAFIRRIFSHVHFELPNDKCLSLLWRKYLPHKLPLAKDVVVNEFIEKSQGLTGANIRDIVLKAAVKTISKNEEFVSKKTFFDAINDVRVSINNSEKDYLPINEKEVSINTEKISFNEFKKQQSFPKKEGE